MVAEKERIDYNGKSGFKASYLNTGTSSWHYHPEYQVVLNIKCNGTRIIGDSVELFDRYDLTFTAPNLPHSWTYYKNEGDLPENHGIVCHFLEESIGNSLLMQHELSGLREILNEAGRGIAFSIADAKNAEPLLHKMVNSTGLEKMAAFFLLMNVLSSSRNKRYLCSDNYKSDTDQRGDLRLNDAYSFIRDNYHKPISLKDVSEVTKMSPFAFSRLFKKHSGAGLIEYINQVRINRACYLLRETETHVYEIAIQCGFQSISNFNRQFRKYNSFSPVEYRRQYR